MKTIKNDQNASIHNCSKKWFNIFICNFKLISSLLGILIGIFLFPQIAFLSEITPEKIIELTNSERLKLNLNNLTANHLLTKAAYKKGQAIIDSNTFQHNINKKKFSKWIKNVGYKYSYIGENLAIDFITSEGVINAWLKSKTHKRNMLNSVYEETGVAVIKNKFLNENTILIIQIFGSPLNIINKSQIAGISTKTYSLTKNNLNNFKLSQSNPENLLTHSTINKKENNLTIIKNNNLFPLTENKKNNMNTFFEQSSYLNNYTLIQFLFYFLSLSILFIILYIYYFTFSRMSKIT